MKLTKFLTAALICTATPMFAQATISTGWYELYGCTSQSSQNAMRLSTNRIQFHESYCDLSTSNGAVPGALVMNANCLGEGESWGWVMTFRNHGSGLSITYPDGSSDTYSYCGP